MWICGPDCKVLGPGDGSPCRDAATLPGGSLSPGTSTRVVVHRSDHAQAHDASPGCTGGSCGSGDLQLVRGVDAGADGSGIRRLTRAGATEAADPAWSPDGRRIAFAKYTRGGIRALGVFVMLADGRRQHRLTGSHCDYDPAWSPRGKQVVVSRCGSQFVVDADGRHPRRLTTPPAGSQDEQPAWAPNGRLIAFVRIDEADRATLYVIHSDGTGARQLTDGGDEHSPTWSPDSRRVGYASYTRIDTVAVTTLGTTTLISMPGSDLENPAWRR